MVEPVPYSPRDPQMLTVRKEEVTVERLEADMERSSLTGLYPQLTLGIGQRFAAKAGYLVRFAGDGTAQLVPLAERSAP